MAATSGQLHCPHKDCSFSHEDRQKVIEHRYFMHDESRFAHIRRRRARLEQKGR